MLGVKHEKWNIWFCVENVMDPRCIITRHLGGMGQSFIQISQHILKGDTRKKIFVSSTSILFIWKAKYNLRQSMEHFQQQHIWSRKSVNWSKKNKMYFKFKVFFWYLPIIWYCEVILKPSPWTIQQCNSWSNRDIAVNIQYDLPYTIWLFKSTQIQ